MYDKSKHVDKDGYTILDSFKEYEPDLMLTFEQKEAYLYFVGYFAKIDQDAYRSTALVLEANGFMRRSQDGKRWEPTVKGKFAMYHHNYHGTINDFETWVLDQRHGRKNYGGPPRRRSHIYPYHFV